MTIEDLVIHPETLLDGFTQSEIGTMDECGMKWYWRYNERLARKGGVVWWAIIGDAWHSTMEQMYATKGKRWSVPEMVFDKDYTPNQADEQKLEFWQVCVEVMAECYYEHYKSEFAILQIDASGGIEQVADIEIEFEKFKIRLKGKLDLRAGRKGGRMALWDHKTTAILNMSMTMGWDFKFQFMFYMWMARKSLKISRFIVNAIKKPGLRLNKGENLAQFRERLKMDMINRHDFYFYRANLDLTTHSMENFENETLMPKLWRLKLIIDPKVPKEVKAAIVLNKNTGACHNWNSTCEFFQLCHHGFKAEGFNYERRPAKHEELGDEE